MKINCYSRFPTLKLDFPIIGYDPILTYSQPPISFITFFLLNTLPDTSGTVRIQSLSSYDRPQINHGWQNISTYDQYDLQYDVNYVRNITKNIRWDQKYIKQELFLGNRYGKSDDLHRQLNLFSAYHQAGTCSTCNWNKECSSL